MSQTVRNLRGSMDIKKRQTAIKQNFIEYRPGAFKEASARIKTARVRDSQQLRLNEEEDEILEDSNTKHMMSSISSPKNHEGDTSAIKRQQQNKKVIMHVNKFIPFYMQYHQLSGQELSEFAKDYAVKENQVMRKQLIDFDTKLIEIFNARRDRYIKKFYP